MTSKLKEQHMRRSRKKRERRERKQQPQPKHQYIPDVILPELEPTTPTLSPARKAFLNY